jgi:hypothetical protein
LQDLIDGGDLLAWIGSLDLRNVQNAQFAFPKVNHRAGQGNFRHLTGKVGLRF